MELLEGWEVEIQNSGFKMQNSNIKIIKKYLLKMNFGYKCVSSRNNSRKTIVI
jgi:hypothetical protein